MNIVLISSEFGESGGGLSFACTRFKSLLEEEFNDMTMDIFYSFYGINGHKKLQNKELSEKYNCGPSKITYYCGRVVEFIKKNKKVRDIFSEINDLMHECLKEYDDNNNNEPHYIKIKENTEVEE